MKIIYIRLNTFTYSHREVQFQAVEVELDSQVLAGFCAGSGAAHAGAGAVVAGAGVAGAGAAAA